MRGTGRWLNKADQPNLGGFLYCRYDSPRIDPIERRDDLMHTFSQRFAIPFVLLACLAYGQASNLASIANDKLTVGFDKATGGLADISSADHAADFVLEPAPTPLLWELHFRSAKGDELRIDNSRVSSPTIVREGGSLSIEWKNLALKDEAASLDVKVTCEIPSGSETAFLRLWVDNRSAQWGLWDHTCPK